VAGSQIGLIRFCNWK